MLLDAQRRLADAEIAYYRALVDYNVAILQVHFRKNSLLEYNGIQLAEGPWPAKAYFDARKRARERDAALFINYGFTKPKVFSRGPMPQQMNQPGDEFENSQITGDDKQEKELVPTPDNAVPDSRDANSPDDLPRPPSDKPSIDDADDEGTEQPQTLRGPRLDSSGSDEQASSGNGARGTRSAKGNVLRVSHAAERGDDPADGGWKPKAK
jgi:hypothetical protein